MKQIKLQEISYNNDEILAVMKQMLNGNVVMGEQTKTFETEWTRKYNHNYSTMVNSGSSANLILINLLTSLQSRYKLQQGDEILVPSVTWPTTLFPIMQMGLKPVLVDVDPLTFNISLDSCKRVLNSKTKAMFIVHLLGNPCNMDNIMEFCDANNLLLLEDCCEATGAKWNDKDVGTFGVGGTFSFMFAHHMTTIEGGMISVNDHLDNKIVKMLRSHGWARNISEVSQKALQVKHNLTDEEFKFSFFDIGYNLRPTELNAVMGIEQLSKIDNFIEIRKKNYIKYWNEMSEWSDYITMQDMAGSPHFSSPFAFGFYLNPEKYSNHHRNKLMKYFVDSGVECRTLVAGNLANQPFVDLYYDKIGCDSSLLNADIIHQNGMYLPLHQGISEEDIEYVCNIFKRGLIGL